MSEIKLKPCPFCGSDNVDIYKHKNENKCVVCYKCYSGSGNYMTDDLAVEAWNRRADERTETI